MVKCTGAEYKAFMSSTDPKFWPVGAWCDDEEVTINGVRQNHDVELELQCPDDARVTIAGGIVFMSEGDDDGPSFESHFKRWRKAQNTVFFACEAPRELADAVKAAIVAAGGKVT